MAEFKDHFSSIAASYAQFRPSYPPSLFDALAARAPSKNLAWDCGCGNGQASHGLAPHFNQVIATDPSEAQIDNAHGTANITFSVAAAEQAPIVPSSAVDLILAAQAAHWFDLSKFYDEVRRVAVPNALLALVSYRPTRIVEGAPDQALQVFYKDVMGPYWPPERRHVDEGYRSLDFPFVEEEGPKLSIEVNWTRDHLLAYIGTWSATKEYKKQNGSDPAEILAEALKPVWSDPEEPKQIYWPLAFRLGRIA